MRRWVTAPSTTTYGQANRQPYRSHGSDRRPFAASIENYPVSIRRGNEDYRNVNCRKAKATQVRSTRDAALGDGTIPFVLRGHIGFVALPTARGAANVPPAALLASVSVDRSARGLGDVHVHGAERAALRVTGGSMTSPIGSEFI